MFLYDRVKQYTYVNGTGAATVSGDLGSFQQFSDVLSDGSRLYYTIENTGGFEVGLGTYSGNAIYRNIIYTSSNSNQRVSFDGSRSNIFLTLPSTGIIYRDENGRVGVGTNNPTYILDVNGSGRFTNSLYVTGNLGVNEVPSSTHGLTVRAPSSQDGIQVKNFNGNVVLLFGANGSNGGRIRLYNGTTLFNVEPSNAYLNNSFTIGSTTANNSNQLTTIASTSTKVPLYVQGAAAQSANLTEWRDSSNNLLSYISNNGSGYFGSGIYSSGDIQSKYIRLTLDGNGGLIKPIGGPNNLTITDTYGYVWLSLAGGGKVHIGGTNFNGNVQVNTNGNVRIGQNTTTPNHKLHVDGSGYFQSGVISSGIVSSSGLLVNGAAAAGGIAARINGSVDFLNSSSVTLRVSSAFGVHCGSTPINFATSPVAAPDLQILRNNAGILEINNGTSGLLAALRIGTQSSTNQPLIVKGAAAQSANLTEWRNSTDSILAYVNHTGSISGANFVTNNISIGTTYDPKGDGNFWIYSEPQSLYFKSYGNTVAYLRRGGYPYFAVAGHLGIAAYNSNTYDVTMRRISSGVLGIFGVLGDNSPGQLNVGNIISSGNGYFQSGILSSGSITTSNTLTIGVYTDAQRPASGNVGTMIFNSTDGNLNIWNGSNWILPDGSVT